MNSSTAILTVYLVIFSPFALTARVIDTLQDPVKPKGGGTILSQNSNPYPTLSQQDMDGITQAMQQAINKAQKTLNEAGYDATRRDNMPQWSTKVEAQQAMTMFEVKKTLMANFKNSESLRSPAVRQKLLRVLNQDNIGISDLAELQNLVLQEKERIREGDLKALQDQQAQEAQEKEKVKETEVKP